MGQQSQGDAVRVWTWDMVQAAALPLPRDHAKGCILAVHAHPDDEASKGAATIARYRGEGATTVLVTCTGGEAGAVLNPLMRAAQGDSTIASLRRAELVRSAQVIGYDHVVLLGYRDSGLSPSGSPAVSTGVFSAQHGDEPVRRLGAVFNLFRPDVVITYPEIQDDYPHPDHLHASTVTRRAFDLAHQPGADPSSTPRWKPTKLYEVLWPDAQDQSASGAPHRALSGSCGGGPTCCTQRHMTPTTRVDVSAHLGVVAFALQAHASQLTLDAQHRLALAAPPHPGPQYDEYVLARDHTERGRITGSAETVETDLLSGCRRRQLETRVAVRRAVPSDAAAVHRLKVAAIRVSAVGRYAADAVEAWASGGSEEGARRMIKRTWGMVATVDEVVVGWANLDGDEVDQLYVHPDIGGHGIARRLYKAVERQARAKGLAQVRAVASLRAEPVFRRFGFREVAREEQIFNGHRFTVVRMRKLLKESALLSSNPRQRGGG